MTEELMTGILTRVGNASPESSVISQRLSIVSF
jgi:hypothetical protein